MHIEAKGVTDSSRNVLTQLEKQSSTWKKIERHFKERLEVLRRRNDIEPIESTGNLRGRIQECKYMLNLGEKSPIPADPDSAGMLE